MTLRQVILYEIVSVLQYDTGCITSTMLARDWLGTCFVRDKCGVGKSRKCLFIKCK